MTSVFVVADWCPVLCPGTMCRCMSAFTSTGYEMENNRQAVGTMTNLASVAKQLASTHACKQHAAWAPCTVLASTTLNYPRHLHVACILQLQPKTHAAVYVYISGDSCR